MASVRASVCDGKDSSQCADVLLGQHSPLAILRATPHPAREEPERDEGQEEGLRPVGDPAQERIDERVCPGRGIDELFESVIHRSLHASTRP